MTDTNGASIILPTYNEEGILEDTVTQLRQWGEQTQFPVEIVIVEDGCTDATPAISARLADTYDNVSHIHRDARQGKGDAIQTGFNAASYDVLCFLDVDLATDLSQLDTLIAPIRTGDADLTVGSRYRDGSNTDRSPLRDVLSRAYNWFARTVLGTGTTDHQCGFKAMSRTAYADIADTIDTPGWGWDTALIYRAQQHGYTVTAVPVTWSKRDGSSVNPVTASVELFRTVIRLKGEDFLGERYPVAAQYVRFATIGAFGALLNTVILYLLTEFADLYYLISAAVAIESAIIAMFFLNNRFTFFPVKKGARDVVDGILRSNLVRSAGAAANISLLYALTEWLGIYYLVSNILAITVASVINFAGEKLFNWQ